MIEVITFKAAGIRMGVTSPGWLGYPILNGEILWIRFEGNSQDEVIKKANAWYDKELVIGRHEIHSDEVSSKPYKKPIGYATNIHNATTGNWDSPKGTAKDDVDPWATPVTILNTHGLSGSVWLIHHGLKKKGRFPASEVDAMLVQGYVRGGPRTQFT